MNLRKFVVVTISTFFYVGFLPLVPGTFGSLGGIFLYYLFKDNLLILGLLTISLLILGFLTAAEAEKVLLKKDARYIVIDEVCGMLLCLLFLPYDIKIVITAFVLFRILDALKPYPADSFQRLKGSLGVMSDDIIAALYTNITLQVLLRLNTFRAS